MPILRAKERGNYPLDPISGLLVTVAISRTTDAGLTTSSSSTNGTSASPSARGRAGDPHPMVPRVRQLPQTGLQSYQVDPHSLQVHAGSGGAAAALRNHDPAFSGFSPDRSSRSAIILHTRDGGSVPAAFLRCVRASPQSPASRADCASAI